MLKAEIKEVMKKTHIKKIKPINQPAVAVTGVGCIPTDKNP